MLKRITSEKAPKDGGLIYTSSQLPINSETNKIDFPKSMKKQTLQTMENVKSILKDNSFSLDKVIKATGYLE